MSEVTEIDQQAITQEQDRGQWLSKEASTDEEKEKLRAQHVAMQLYKALGVNVPDTHIQEENGIVRFSTMQVPQAKQIQYFDSELPKLLADPKMYESLLAHHFMGDGKIASSLKMVGDQPMWMNASGAFSMDSRDPFAFSFLSEPKYRFSKEVRDENLIKASKIGGSININSVEFRPMAEKIAQLEPQFILNLLRNSGLALEARINILYWLLFNRQEIQDRLTSLVDQPESEQNPVGEAVENLYNQRNEKLYVRHRDIEITLQTLETYARIKSEMATILEGSNAEKEQETTSEEESKMDFAEKMDYFQSKVGGVSEGAYQLIEKQLNSGWRIMDLDRFYTQAQELGQIQEGIRRVRQEIPPLLARISGKHTRMARLETRTDAIRGRLKKAWVQFQQDIPVVLQACVENYSSVFPKEIAYKSTEPQLEPFAVIPSSEHLQAFKRLESLAGETNTLELTFPKDLGKKISEIRKLIKKRRQEFQKKSHDIQHALVSHVTPYDSALEILKSGHIKSPLRQSNDVPEGSSSASIWRNSPEGRMYLLPQVVFSVDGAESGYGSMDHGASGQEHSVAFVDTYPSIVKNNLFLESPTTGGSVARTELHVFGSDYGKTTGKGASINIESARFIVPERDREKWKQRLLEIGKDEKWIEEHLKGYPEDIPFHFYLSEWSHELGIPEEKPGAPVSVGKEGVYIQTVQAKGQLFEWKTQEVLQS